MKNIFCSIICLMSLMSFSSNVEIMSYPVEGGWTTNIYAALEIADTKNIPLVLICSSAGCSLCNIFENNVFTTDEFQNYIQTNGYIGVKTVAVAGNFTYDPHKKMLSLVGGGTLPRFTCYWKKKNGEIVDARKNCICGYGHTSQWIIDYVENLIGEYTNSHSADPTPESKEIVVSTSTTTNVVQQNDNYIEISYPNSINEGTYGNIHFKRTGSSKYDLTIHVLTNGFWLADVHWNANEYSTKVVKIPVVITDEFDHGRTITVYVKSLNRTIQLR